MIKIVSLIVFISAFLWTWFLFTGTNKMGIEIHAGIQSQLTQLIEDTLKAKKPYVSNFKLLKMYTEKLDDQKVKAVFSYQFDDAESDSTSEGLVTQTISGEAILTKGLSENKNIQKWSIQNVKSDNQSVMFKDGLTVNADGTTSEETEQAPANAEDVKSNEPKSSQ